MTNIQSPGKDLQNLLVTRPYLPNLKKYMKYVEQAFDNQWLTNGGPLLQELTFRLQQKLGVDYLLLVNNGTTALQLAYKVKGLEGKKVLTTPFTFPATTTALQWQQASICYADIDPQSWNLCANSTRVKMSELSVEAVVPVNIFGAPCDMEAFDKIGQDNNVPIIYDSAQSMLSKYKGKSVLQYGDIHCISFHATKLFHCVEGGALTFKNEDDYIRAKRLVNFGFDDTGQVREAGINAKMSELHAAMGLCVLDDLASLIEDRERSVDIYKKELGDLVNFQSTSYSSFIPPMYMPIEVGSSTKLDKIQSELSRHNIQARKYFSPDKNLLLKPAQIADLSVTNKLSSAILCLPLMYGLSQKQIQSVTNLVKQNF